jgi:GT2 family glycosyltransferase
MIKENFMPAPSRPAGRRNPISREMAVLRFELEAARARNLALETRLQEMHASRSWQLTAPIRWGGRRMRNARTLWRIVRLLAREPDRIASTCELVRKEWRAGGLEGVKRALFIVAAGADGQDKPEQRLLQFSDALGREMIESMAAWPRQPTISILMPTYDTPADVLRQAIDSVRGQLYERWELCIGDDGSTDPQVRTILEAYARSDARIKIDVGHLNEGVSSATNRALALATGEFVALLDHDDILERQAIFRIAEAVVADDPDFVYSDEAIVGPDGQEVLGFALRPQFSLEYLRSHPYIVHLIAFRTTLLRDLGGLDTSLAISQDYDLILRAVERAERIVHIPEVLYRWRTQPGSVGHQRKDRVMESSKAVLAAHLARTHTPGEVHDGLDFNFFEIRYPLEPGSRVAIVIPTKNHGALVRQCIESIERTVLGVDYRIVLVDHDSNDAESVVYFDSLRERHVVLNYTGPFNFSAINNWAVRRIPFDCTHYLFCNNDIEAIEEGWLDRMLELGQRPGTGAVGAKLLYPGAEVCQHAGVGVGMFGAAEHYGKFMKVHTADGDPERGYMGGLIANREMSAVTAACMLVRKDVFEQVHGYDEQLAVGFGDVDLCLRIRAADYLVVLCANAQLIHHESISRGKSTNDPHPEDSALFRARWADFLAVGDPYFHPSLSHTSTRWAIDPQASPKRLVHRRMVSVPVQ